MTSSGEAEDSSFDGESDSATEMALITASFHGTLTSPATTHFAQHEGQAETTDYSSQDTPLCELQEQVRGTKAQGSSQNKRQKIG